MNGERLPFAVGKPGREHDSKGTEKKAKQMNGKEEEKLENRKEEEKLENKKKRSRNRRTKGGGR